MSIKFLSREEADSCREYLEKVPKKACKCGVLVPNEAFLMHSIGDFHITCGRCGRTDELEDNPYNAFTYAKLVTEPIFDPEPWRNSAGAEFVKVVSPVPQSILPEHKFTEADALKVLLSLIKGMVTRR